VKTRSTAWQTAQPMHPHMLTAAQAGLYSIETHRCGGHAVCFCMPHNLSGSFPRESSSWVDLQVKTSVHNREECKDDIDARSPANHFDR
jgi:hypothetical protein